MTPSLLLTILYWLVWAVFSTGGGRGDDKNGLETRSRQELHEDVRMLAEGKKPKFLGVVRADPELVEAISRATQVETWRGHCCCCQVDLALPEGGSFAYFATNSCAQESGGRWHSRRRRTAALFGDWRAGSQSQSAGAGQAVQRCGAFECQDQLFFWDQGQIGQGVTTM